MAFDAIDIAGFVVDIAHKEGRSVTNLHLQKILYYLECKYLFEEGIPLFKDDIEAWKLGPVYPEVYHEYKVFGSDHIQFIPKIYKIIPLEEGSFKFENYSFKPDLLPSDLRERLLPDIKILLTESPFELVMLTHKHEQWVKFQPEIESNKKGLKYDKNKLKEYFKSHPSLLSEVFN